MKLESNYQVIIIGAGPGGLSAAIYLKRAGITPLILESNSPGGNLNKTHKIENYPGYVDQDGTTLAFRMYSQVEELDVPFKTEKVVSIKREDKNYSVITESNIYSAEYIILASGKIPRKLSALNAEKYEGKGISYCTICDGTLYKNKVVAIIGGGNSAMESALYMSDLASKVYVINRSSVLRADEKEQRDIVKKTNVQIIYNSKVLEVIGTGKRVSKIKLDSGTTLDIDAVFVCIGQEKNDAYYEKLMLKTDNKGILVNNNMKTSLDNVYACGDVLSKELYQVVTATSEGAVAATSIIKSIKNSSNFKI